MLILAAIKQRSATSVIFMHLICMVSSLPIDASALERAISALESAITALDTSSGNWERLLPWSTALVVVGVTVEIVVIWLEHRAAKLAWRRGIFQTPSRPSSHELVWALIGSILVTIGVAGELWVGIEIAQINGSLRTKNEELHSKTGQLIALLTVEAEGAKRDSERASALVAGLEQDVAKAKTEMANQQARAAAAEKDLLDLKERIKPRRLTDQQCIDFIKALKALPGGVIDVGYTSAGGDETFNFARQFLPLFKQAGWTVRNEASIANHFDIQVIGVGILTSVPAGPNPAMPPSGYIELTPTLETVRDAFRAVGIEVQFINWFPGKTAPELVMGSKPEPKL